MRQVALLNPEGVSEEEAKAYRVREAARAVVADSEGKIALLHVTKDAYYKLPGGGIERGEDEQVALRRECREEIGCDIGIEGEIGFIVEYRKIRHLRQVSYCYFARVNGGKRAPHFTDEENERGFEPVWLPHDKVMDVMAEGSTADTEGGMYIVPRDTLFLKEVKDMMR